MKNILTLIITLISFLSVSQMMVNIPLHNVLYRTYANYVEGYADNSGKNIRLTAEKGYEGLQISKSGKGWIVKTSGSTRQATLCLVNEKNDTILRETYIVLPLPSPEINWSVKNDGENWISSENDSIWAETCLTGAYKKYVVEQWSINLNGKNFKGSGAKITKEVAEALNNLNSDKTVNVTAVFSGGGFVGRVGDATFSIGSSFFTKERMLAKDKRFFVVDKTPENACFFDETDPNSLVALGHYVLRNKEFLDSGVFIKTNYIIDYNTQDYLRKNGVELTSGYTQEINVPALDVENGEPIYEIIYDSIFGDSVTQYLYKIYQSVDYSDLSEISRIIFFEKEEIDPETGLKSFTLEKIAFAKKYLNIKDTIINNFFNDNATEKFRYVITYSMTFEDSVSNKNSHLPFSVPINQNRLKELMNPTDKSSFYSVLVNSNSLLSYSSKKIYDLITVDQFKDSLRKIVASDKLKLVITLKPSSCAIDSLEYIFSFNNGKLDLVFLHKDLKTVNNKFLADLINSFENNKYKNVTPQFDFIRAERNKPVIDYFYPGDSDEELLKNYYLYYGYLYYAENFEFSDVHFGSFFK